MKQQILEHLNIYKLFCLSCNIEGQRFGDTRICVDLFMKLIATLTEGLLEGDTNAEGNYHHFTVRKSSDIVNGKTRNCSLQLQVKSSQWRKEEMRSQKDHYITIISVGVKILTAITLYF